MLNFLMADKPISSRKLSRTVSPTSVERHMKRDEIIVSKTDLKGTIIYVNDVFLTIADYQEHDMIGAPHSVIRHPDMPRCVFKLMWDTLGQKKEIFAYVKNMAANGDYYWVLAHVTPSYNAQGEVVGYHSNRRAPERRIIDQIITPLYTKLLQEERRHPDRKSGLDASTKMLMNIITETGKNYDEFILSL